MKQLLILSILILSFTACGLGQNDAGVRVLSTSELRVPVDATGKTSEQRNIMKRREVALNPNQIMWIYCLADNGQVIFYGAVRGKVTSSTKSLDDRLVDSVGTLDYSDGSTGESDKYVYWFDPSEKYFQWNGNYFLSTFEIKIQTPVLNTRKVD